MNYWVARISALSIVGALEPPHAPGGGFGRRRSSRHARAAAETAGCRLGQCTKQIEGGCTRVVAKILSVEPWAAVYLEVPREETDFLARWPVPRASYHQTHVHVHVRIRIGRQRTDGTGGRAACARIGSKRPSIAAAIAPCVCPAAAIRLSISAGSAIGHWQMGKGSSVVPPPPLPTMRAACSHPNSQQHTRACLSEPLRLSSRPFDVRVRAPLRAAVAWCRSSPPVSAPLLRAPPAAECRITAVSCRRLRVRLRVGFASWGVDGGDPIGCGANKQPRVIVPRPTTASTVLSS